MTRAPRRARSHPVGKMRPSRRKQASFRERARARIGASAPVALVLIAACSFDSGSRWLEAAEEPAEVTCEPGTRVCGTSELLVCVDDPDDPRLEPEEDCEAAGRVCAPTLGACVSCIPDEHRCAGDDVEICLEDGSGYRKDRTCDTSGGAACRAGSCVDLCAQASEERSNVGCEYWAVDLDNANIDESLNAAAQQFAVVISNPQPDVTAEVTIERDDSEPGTAGAPVVVTTAPVLPLSLQVFRLGPREVDGSPPGQYDTGTHTALTRAAYRVRTSVPVVAYQFNPLENVNVFSNDASLLKPVEALVDAPGNRTPSYVVLGWPQTIASTDDPDTNFSSTNPTDLRAFLTLVGTREGTHVRVTPTTAVLGGEGIPSTRAGEPLDLELAPFEVANLETDAFAADFTGTLVEADQPVVVFSGGEASDAPLFETLAERWCCADHLEEQLDPIRTAGKQFIASVSPNRTQAIVEAGGDIGPSEAPDYFRVIAVTEAGANVQTTLEGASASIELRGRGDFAQIASSRDFYIESDEPIMLGAVSPSQEAAGVPSGYPGGDPSFIIVPPIEQFRDTYVFLTPDRYGFDFIRILAPDGVDIRFDDQPLSSFGCDETPLLRPGSSPSYSVYRCQLSFPVIDTSAGAEALLSPGRQNDGVHDIVASAPVGVLVDGFDRNVSYAYAAGTELREIIPR